MIKTGKVLDFLVCDEPCIGALFTSYGFTPSYFENEVLRTLFDLQSDPEERTLDYLREAREKLQQVPVSVIVDAGERRGGRRLIYDIYEVELKKTAFHPKSILLLFQNRARLIIGSGNLTKQGYTSNLEIFAALDISYQDRKLTHLLGEYIAFIERIRPYIRQRGGRQLLDVTNALNRRCDSLEKKTDSTQVCLLSSTLSPLKEQIDDLIPRSAKISSLSLMAPYFEMDEVGRSAGSSILNWFPATRLLPDAKLELGLEWENELDNTFEDKNQLLADLDNRVWMNESGEGQSYYRKFVIPRSKSPKLLKFLDERGYTRQMRLVDIVDSDGNIKLQPLKQPIAFAPKHAVEGAKKQFQEIEAWLYPVNQPATSSVSKRSLHAKLILIAYIDNGKPATLLILGSANMSKRALLLKAGKNEGNFELNFGFKLKGLHTLIDLLPEMVKLPLDLLEFREREPIDPIKNYSLAIQEATYDPETSSLKIIWSDYAQELLNWKICYQDQLIEKSTFPPKDPTLSRRLELSPLSLELTLNVDGKDYDIPIIITDVVALPEIEGNGKPGLEELLMLLGHRIGKEEVVYLTSQKRDYTTLDVENIEIDDRLFRPTDVYKAWWSLAEDLSDPNLSVTAFRYRLEGALGLRVIWKEMLIAVEKEGGLQASEVWFYGAELLKSLWEIDYPISPDINDKMDLLAMIKKEISQDMHRLIPDKSDYPWLQTIEAFYQEYLS